MARAFRYSLLAFFLAIVAMAAEAQSINRLVLPDVAVQAGASQLPVSIENDDEIVAAQFDITLPAGITAGQTAAMTGRADGHVMAVRPLGGSRYRVMLYSAENRPLLGQSGMVAYIPVTVSSSLPEGSEYPLVVTDAVLSNLSADNVLTQTVAGTLRVSRLPDLEVKDVAVGSLTAVPGERLLASWSIENVGELSTGGGWSEQLSLVSADGNTVRLLTTAYYNDSLAAKATVKRDTTVTVPMLLGIDGPCRLQVRVIPGEHTGEALSAQANNTLLGDQVLTVDRQLTLTLTPVRVMENETTSILATLNRSGLWTTAQTFQLTATADSRLTVPSEVTIPVGQSGTVFYLQIANNSVLDADSVVTVTASGNDYAPVTATLAIEDDEHPALTLSLSKTDLQEGATFQLTVTLGRASATPVTVYLACEDSRRFSFPSQITIPAGALSTTVDVTVIDDDEVTTALTTAFTASAEGYDDSAEAAVILTDDDMPELQLTLTPATVSESAGISAIMGTLRRTGSLNSKVTIQLSDDSNGLLYYPMTTLTMKKDESEVTFSIGVNDDAFVNGNREVHLSAAVYVASCDCYSSGQMAGNVTQTITVLDDDGPALKLIPSASAFLEGSTGNSITIERNADIDHDLTISLSSDYDAVLTYEHTVVIPAGQTKVTVPVTVASNDTEDDDKPFTFTATAQGFTQGTCGMRITDQTMPDAVVTSFEVSTQEAEAESTVTMTVTIRNNGNYLLRRGTPIYIYVGEKVDTLKLTTDRILSPGQQTSIQTEYSLPRVPGTHTVHAVVNAKKNVNELDYTNNYSAEVPLTILPSFTVTAKTDKNQYSQGEIITVTGKATGAKIANTEVEVYFITNGIRQTTTANTDGQGNYTARWMPLDGLSGHFLVGACFPGMDTQETMDEFDIYGLQTKNYSTTCRLREGTTSQGFITVTNPGRLPQTNVRVEMLSSSALCEFVFTKIDILEGGQTVDIPFTVKGIGSSTVWQKIPVAIKSDEHASIGHRINCLIEPIEGKLCTESSRISTTMTMGTAREYPLVIWNSGSGETGKIKLVLPAWMQTLTPREMPSLAPGDTTTVILRLMPQEDMRLNVPVTGHFSLNCAKATGLTVSFEVTPVSERMGTLTVDVTDEFTEFTEEAPHVSGAWVKVVNPSTRAVVAEGITDDNGLFSVGVQEGWYQLVVSADKHDTQRVEVLVDPGKVSKKVVYLPYDAISVDWQVVETEVEDEYSFETVVKYETHVPVPVIEVKWPDYWPETGEYFPITLTNKGLINANNVLSKLSITGAYEIEMLGDTYKDVLPPQQTMTFYARIVDKAAGGRMKAASTYYDPCIELVSGTTYDYDCGKKTNPRSVILRKTKGSCKGGTGSGGGGGGGGGATSYQAQYNPPQPCNKEKKDDEDEVERDDEEEEPDDEEEPEETDDCDEKPVFNYRINPKEARIQADGFSQLIISLDNGASRIPSDECGYNNFHWVFSPDIGDTPRGGYKGVTYTAPTEDELCDNEIITITATPYVDDREGHTILAANPIKFNVVRAKWSFKLVEVDESNHIVNENREWKGVAADGVSKLKFVLDRTNIKKVYGDDYEITNVQWSMPQGSKGVTLDNMNTIEPILTAPVDFPSGVNASSITVPVSVHFNLNGIAQEGTVNVEVTRVPLVLLHGLFGKPDTWGQFANIIVREGLYDNYQIDYEGYEGSNSSQFSLNEHVPGKKINNLFKAYKNRHQILVSKADLVGHSMGGILARLHVQDVNKHNVHKLITVNTPHSGSEWGDFFAFLKEMNVLCFYSWCIDLGAVPDLAVNSEAIKHLNGRNFADPNIVLGKMNDIPIHAISTRMEDEELRQISGDLSRIKQLISFFFPKTDFILTLLQGLGYDPTEVINNYLIPSDGVVSLESQKGGLDDIAPVSDHSHIGSTDDENVQERLKYLLMAGVSDPMFRYGGFHPHERSYNSPGSSGGGGGRMPKRITLKEPEAPAFLYVQQTGNDIDIQMQHVSEDSKFAILVVEGDSVFNTYDEPEVLYPVPATFKGSIHVMGYCLTDDSVLVKEGKTIDIKEPRVRPVRIQLVDEGNNTLYLNDVLRTKLKCTWEDGSETFVLPESISSPQGIMELSSNELVAVKTGSDQLSFNYCGLTYTTHVTVLDFGEEEEEDDDEDSEGYSGVCATVTLAFHQSAVMTRQAFRGTLTINNGHEGKALTDLRLNLEVRDEKRKLATQHEFQMNPESLDGFLGQLDFNTGWTLQGGKTGTATILFIPTKYAAPNEPKEWSFGGSLSYTDPGTGLKVTRELTPVTLTVKPSPNLDFTFFMQRDIYGDDPFTDNVEPMQPAEFALLINNKGNGDATNLRMTTQQPEIIENEKGLLINFEILSTQLNGQEENLALGGSVTTDFGTIPAQSQAYAQWWLQSSLLGHFIEYDVNATHVTSYGNADLSLLDQVSIHELIHGFTARADGDIPLRGFLVNDVKDAKDLPDMLYLSDASQQGVYMADGATTARQSDTDYLLTVRTSQSGWNYGTITDPTGGRMLVEKIVRQSDGTELPVDNIWQTDRTLRDGKDWLYENRLHFIGNMPEGGEQYLITFKHKPNVSLIVDTYEGVPNEGTEYTGALTEVVVHFNKPVSEESFTADDITLFLEGTKVDISAVTISRVDEQTFKLSLGTATSQAGFYVLAVNTEGIIDSDGFEGGQSKETSWLQTGGGSPGAPIPFADAEVKRICVENWDSNGDGELSYAEAAAVTDLGMAFHDQQTIVTFDELQYFAHLEVIGISAFAASRRLRSVTLPNSLKVIKTGAFSADNSLVSLHIPRNVETIETRAIYGISNMLESITVDEDNPYYDSRDNCNAIIETSTNALVAGCKTTTIPVSVKRILPYAFGLQWPVNNVVLHQGISEIGDGAFLDCDLLSVRAYMTTPPAITENTFSKRSKATLHVPSGCKAAYQSADYWKDFKCILELGSEEDVPDEFEVDGVKYRMMSKEDHTVEVIPGNSIIYYWDHKSTTGDYWGDIIVPAKVIFNDLTYFPRQVAEFTFVTDSLKSVMLPEGMRTLSVRSFNGCSNLSSLTIPSTLDSIALPNFYGLSNLLSLSVMEGNSRYDSRNNCNAIIETATNTLISGCKNTVIPDNVVKIGNRAFAGRDNLIEMAIPESVAIIDTMAFYACEGLASIVIPASVHDIGHRVFAFCSSLSSISVDAGNTVFDSRNNCNAIIRTDENRLLYGCQNTQIPSSVRIIGTHAFYGHENLRSIHIPEGVTTIDTYAFEYTSLKEITLPRSINRIGQSAFRGCDSLLTVYSLNPQPPVLGPKAFEKAVFNEHDSIYHHATLYVPKGSKALYETTDEWKNFKTIEEMEGAEQTLQIAKGWNWVSSSLQEPLPLNDLAAHSSRILGQKQELIRDPVYGMTGGLTALEADKGYKVKADEDATLTFTGTSRDGEEASIAVARGWNWVGYPYMQGASVSIITNAAEGDYIVGQRGFTEYADGGWLGTLTAFTPGEGYLYKSAEEKMLTYGSVTTDTRRDASTPRWMMTAADATLCEALCHIYPATMSITVRLYSDGLPLLLTATPPRLYAMAGSELRGIGVNMGDSYYLTVYGDKPVDITFIVEDAATGEQTPASETLTFRDEVVGSRKQPFIISTSKPTAIDEQISNQDNNSIVYDLQGRRVSSQHSVINGKLKKGIYIIKGNKVVIRTSERDR